jgi:hypothetical protein
MVIIPRADFGRHSLGEFMLRNLLMIIGDCFSLTMLGTRVRPAKIAGTPLPPKYRGDSAMTIRFLIKKLSSLIRDESANSNTPAVPPWFPPARRAPPLRGQSSDSQITIHVLWVTSGNYGFPTGRVSLAPAFRLQLRKDFQLVGLPRLAPIPGSLTGNQAYSFPSSLFDHRLRRIIP